MRGVRQLPARPPGKEHAADGAPAGRGERDDPAPPDPRAPPAAGGVRLDVQAPRPRAERRMAAPRADAACNPPRPREVRPHPADTTVFQRVPERLRSFDRPAL